MIIYDVTTAAFRQNSGVGTEQTTLPLLKSGALISGDGVVVDSVLVPGVEIGKRDA